jgi:hypothetical protein
VPARAAPDDELALKLYGVVDVAVLPRKLTPWLPET